MSKALIFDTLERIGWTAAEIAAGVAVVELADLPYWWAAPVIAVATAVKGWATKHTGDPNSGSVLR